MGKKVEGQKGKMDERVRPGHFPTPEIVARKLPLRLLLAKESFSDGERRFPTFDGFFVFMSVIPVFNAIAIGINWSLIVFRTDADRGSFCSMESYQGMFEVRWIWLWLRDFRMYPLKSLSLLNLSRLVTI